MQYISGQLVAGNGQSLGACDPSSNGVPAINAGIWANQLAISPQGDLLMAGETCVQRVDASGLLHTVAGGNQTGFGGDEGPAVDAVFSNLTGLAVDSGGRIFVSDSWNHRIRMIDQQGLIHTVAGGTPGVGTSGDGGPALAARLAGPGLMAVGPDNSLYFADSSGGMLRRIDPLGVISTVAGRVDPPVDGRLTRARLSIPVNALSWPDDQHWLLADAGSGRLRLFSLSQNRLRTVVGYPGVEVAPAPMPARFSAVMDLPSGMAVDEGTGEVFISERGGHVIHRLTATVWGDPSTWTISTVAGQHGMAGHHDGSAQDALFAQPVGLAMDSTAHRLWIADTGNHDIRVMDTQRLAEPDAVRTVAGIPGAPGFDGDGHPAMESLLRSPEALLLAQDGTTFISDTGNHRVRALRQGTLVTILGDGAPTSSGAGSPSRDYPVDTPRGLALDAWGNLFVAARQTIRLVTADAQGSVTPEATVLTIYGSPPRTRFPDSVTQCLGDVRFSSAQHTLWAVDSCQGYLLTLTLTSLP